MYVTLNLMITGVAGFTAFLMMGMDGYLPTKSMCMVMPWKVVTRHGKNMTLAVAVDRIFSRQESEAKERERRERERKKKSKGSVKNIMRHI